MDRIQFDFENPFPNLEFGSYSYAMAKEHAAQVDSFLGFNCHAIESSLQKPAAVASMPQEAWIGLDVQSFMTPYVEIRTALELMNLQAGDRLVDLGCGYARMAHIIGRHHPGIYFIGYELVRERVCEANRVLAPFQYANVRVEERDLTSSAPEEASHYFIYDYGSNLAIQKTLSDLQEVAKRRPIQVVGRGRASRMIIHRDHPWLCEVHPPRHFDTFSIFQS
jgi:precorrin-6B methylase 2